MLPVESGGDPLNQTSYGVKFKIPSDFKFDLYSRITIFPTCIACIRFTRLLSTKNGCCVIAVDGELY